MMMRHLAYTLLGNSNNNTTTHARGRALPHKVTRGRRDWRYLETRDRSGGTSFFLSGLDRYIRWKKVAKRCTRIASLARETWHEIPAGRKRHSLPPSLFLSLSFSSDNTEFGPIRWNCCGPTGCLRRVYIYIYIPILSRRTRRGLLFSHVGSLASLSLSLSLFSWFRSITVRAIIIRRKGRNEGAYIFQSLSR